MGCYELRPVWTSRTTTHYDDDQQCAQIQLHDVLYKVDQTIVSGWDLDDVCNLIKGIIRIVSTQMLIPMHIRQSVKILPSRPMYSSAYS